MRCTDTLQLRASKNYVDDVLAQSWPSWSGDALVADGNVFGTKCFHFYVTKLKMTKNT